MNGGAHMNNSAKRFNRPAQWLRVCGWLCLLLARPAMATDPVWPPTSQLGQVFNYTVPGNPPPAIDATNFDNENQFTINFSSFTANPEIFETLNTVNYTNNGLMVANSPVTTNGLFITLNNLGCGFLFDTQTTNVIARQMAGTFYNPGAIRVNSVYDTGEDFFSLLTAGLFNVWATNIVNPGTVSVGENGLLQFTGQKVDLTRSQIDIENLNTELNVLSNLFTGLIFEVPLNLTVLNSPIPPAVGHETNYIDPAVAFSLPNPASDDFLPPLYLGLQNATAYVNDTGPIASNRLVRAVFISNPVPNVVNNVYFNDGFGDILVQWAGSYLNPATGLQKTNFMYLEDDFGEVTNLQLLVGGGPITYDWLAQWPFLLGPAAPPGIPAGLFNNSFITNDFAYESVQLVATTVATNASLQNPSGALTNLPGRIQITANNVLDLTLAQISGPNYMSVTSTNHFKGSGGAAIFSPYSDINLGVTNGFLSVSNLLAPSVPNWNGPVQVFSARWKIVDALGVTNNYHVLLVNSGVVPTTPPVVQNLTLHSTNLFVSDTFNIIGALSIDATSLTLTTNLNTAGFGSQDGELNWYGPTAFGLAQLPNLRWLTNNGALRAANLAVFGSSPASYGAFINSGLVSDQGTTIFATNFLSSGIISNGLAGSFTLQSLTTTLTNGSVMAGGNVSITTGNLLASNVVISAGRSFTLSVTNSLIDTGPSPTNGNLWALGNSSVGSGLNLPVKPVIGDLRGTTITNVVPVGRNVINTWAATDYGVSTAGFTNNVAIGRLILNSLGTAPNTQFTFNGAGASNAIYVDQLTLLNYASYTNRDSSGTNLLAFNFNNLVIYYADAMAGGVDVSEKLNHKNNNHFRWVPAYAGYYSSTNIVYPDGTTNTVNTALAQSSDIDSDGDGVDNAHDPTPFFTPNQVNFTLTETNLPPLAARLAWQTIPDATNTVLYRTNLAMTSWLVLTNFVTPPAPPYAPISTNVLDTFNPAFPKFYRVLVNPNSTDFSGQ
jgi:hypothetical protein